MTRTHARTHESGLFAVIAWLFLGASVTASLSFGFNTADAANVSWSVGDSVAACPSGDTLSTTVTRPSRLRVAIQYLDAAFDPRVGVPPESLYVTLVTVSGNIKANDKASFTYADDSTNAEGKAWITLPSLSGCGRLQVFLTVSNATQGGRSATVRTTDHNADGRVDSADLGPGAQCDLNYSGSANATDLSLVVGHNLHWRRLALHGTLVRRTNLCDTCIGNSPNTYGEGRSFWSPNGRWISYTIHDPNLVDVCNAYILPSAPKDGNVPRKITFATTRDGSVYDPTWSPLGHELVYERFGIGLYRKGVVGVAADTSEYLVISASTGDRVVYPVFSPDADSIAFTYATGTTTNDINTIAISGGARRNLTFNFPDNFDDRYPSWACDGRILIVDRAVAAQSSRRRIYKVPIDANDPADAALFYQPPTPQSARVPYYSPDSLVIVAAVGTTATQTALTTFETSQPPGLVKAIRSNYPGYFDVNLYAVPSPDGTRLLLAARDPRISGAQSAQVFATRRNMSLPPQIAQVGPTSVVDSTAVVTFCVSQGSNFSYDVSASDPEGDPITYAAYFLQSWMSFVGQTLTVAPGGTPGKIYNVVLQATTPSGGTDRIIARVTVGCNSPGFAAGPSVEDRDKVDAQLFDGPNPMRNAFAVWTPIAAGVSATLRVFDLTGRRIADIGGRSGSPLVWNGLNHDGVPARSGLYFYQVQAGAHRRTGRVVVAR